ncbi:Hypothetical predicted protein [Octopus vulgaris]|nr:Hypothetical predicted protein [Octopus vulgaris]
MLQRDNYNTTETTNDTKVVFNDICNGNYVIYVKPFDPHESESKKCLCYKTEGRCKTCKATIKQIPISELDDSKCNETTKLITAKIISTPVSSPTVISTPVSSTPVISTPVISTPVISTSVISTPLSSTPVISTPVISTPVSSTPVISTSVISTPVISTSVISTPLSSTPVISTPVSSTPVSSTPVNESSSTKNSMFEKNSTTTARTTTTSTNKGIQQSEITWPVIGSLAALLMAFTFICFILLAKRESPTDKKILFLYSHDHQHHLDVGKAMATYLQHFKCHVLYPPLFAEEEIKQWLHKTVADCDFVLLLHSECIKRQSEPWASGLEYPQLRDNRNENVLMSILTMIRECPLLQLYHSKYISCRLEHLSEGYVLTEFPSVQNFVLTRDLKKLVYYIHRIPPNSVLKTLTLRFSDSSTSSLALQQAAQKAAEFEKNKMWFTQKYSYLVPRCGVLNDKCDCRSALNEEFDGTVDIPKLSLNSFHDVNFDDSMSTEYCYFNDIHSFSEMSLVSSELEMLNERNDQQDKNRYNVLPSLSEDTV